MNIYSSSISKTNLNHKDQIILLMTPKREGWYHLVVKKMPGLLGGEMTSKHDVVIFIARIVFIPSEPNNLNSIKASVKIKILVVL